MSIGSIPSELGELTSLTLLQLYDNKLTGVIVFICVLTACLESYSCFFFLLFSGYIPTKFGDLTDLSALRLSSNILEGKIEFLYFIEICLYSLRGFLGF